MNNLETIKITNRYLFHYTNYPIIPLVIILSETTNEKCSQKAINRIISFLALSWQAKYSKIFMLNKQQLLDILILDTIGICSILKKQHLLLY